MVGWGGKGEIGDGEGGGDGAKCQGCWEFPFYLEVYSLKVFLSSRIKIVYLKEVVPMYSRENLFLYYEYER